jgi:hypothetical protein
LLFSGFGWAVLGVSVGQFLLWIVWYVFRNRSYGFPEMINKTFTHENWGPTGQARLESWKKFKEDALQENRKKEKSFFWHYFDILIGR